jgi:nucleolar protein 6
MTQKTTPDSSAHQDKSKASQKRRRDTRNNDTTSGQQPTAKKRKSSVKPATTRNDADVSITVDAAKDVVVDEEAASPASNVKDDAQLNKQAKPQSRYIVFVGNLPRSATSESIAAHFASLSPLSVA